MSLLQPGDRRSLAAGDTRELVRARRAWFESGRMAPLVDALVQELDALELPPRAAVADLGCGPGDVLAKLAKGRELRAFGLDLSRDAVDTAARGHRSCTWLVANADRRLPFADGSLDLVLSIHARRNASECARVLRPTGALLLVLPASDDLGELRAAVQGEAHAEDRAARALAELGGAFALERRRTLRWRSELDPTGIAAALALTYRGARSRERERAQGLASLAVTQAHELLVLRPAPPPEPGH